MADDTDATEFTVPEGEVYRVTYPAGNADIFEAGAYRLEGYGALIIDQFAASLRDALMTADGAADYPVGSSPVT